METRKILAILVLALGLMVWMTKVSEAGPMGTAFTYQGLLYDTNDVANGEYDFQFKLYDANSGGSQIGSDVNIADEDVIDALFTVELDFGSSVFDGNAVWLEIGVRPGEMNDPNEYTILTPRQEITPTPYALYAKTAPAGHSLDAADGLPKDAVYVDNNGDVGIGTASPGVKLQVGDTSVGHDVYIAGSTSSQSGLFFYDGAIPGGMRYNFSSDDLSIFTAGTTNLMIDSSGKVGIGTTSPAVKLQVGDTDVGHDVYIAGSTNSQSGLFFYDGSIPGGMRYNFSTDDLSVFTSGSTRMMIDSAGDVGIGTLAPGAKLEVNGQVKITGGSPGAGKVLTSDASGLASWQTPDGGLTLPYAGITSTSGYAFSISNSGSGYGVRGDASGGNGRGVVGRALNMGDVSNYGGHFWAAGNYGRGVYGVAGGSEGIGVCGVGGQYDFYAEGPGIDYGTSSSIRWKRDIRAIDDPLEKVLRLRGVYFNWDAEHGGEHDVGMIAEEVGEMLPEIVEYEPDGKYTSGMDYSKLTPLLVEAVKALKIGADERQKELAKRDVEIAELKARLANVESAIAKMSKGQKGGRL